MAATLTPDGDTRTIITDVRIFTGDAFIEKGYVVVSKGIISEVGQGSFQGQLESPGSIVSRPGDTLLPGLIDCHIHALGGNIHSIEQSIRFGVTTVCDMHNEPRHNEQLYKLASDPQNKNKYSDFKCVGLGAVIEEGWPIPVMRKEFEHVPDGKCIAEKLIGTWPKLKTAEDAGPYVERQVRENKAFAIKMFHEVGDSIGMPLPEPPMEVQGAVVEAAHQHGVLAVGHAFSHAGAMALLRAGADGLTHMFLDEPPSDEFVQLMKAQGAHCSPTLALCGSQTGQIEGLQRRFTEDAFAQRMLVNTAIGRPVGFAMSEHPRSSMENAGKSVKKLYEARIPLLVGTDAAGKEIGTPYGLGVHMEMWLLGHEVGMKPIDVLKAATSTTADRFGFNDRGRIEAGRKADLVLISGDVTLSLSDRDSLCLPVKAVWREGVAVSGFGEPR